MEKNKKLSLQTIKRPPKLSLQVESQIRDAIDKQVFTKGENLPSESNLCEIYGVSRNVIREALSILSAKGLIEIQKGKCAVICEPSINNVLDSFSQLVNFKCGDKGLMYILFVRKLIEPSAASLSAQNRSKKDIHEMERCLELMRISKDDMVKFSQWDIGFHNAIAKSCDNPMIPIVLEPIFHVLAKFHPPIFYDNKIEENTIFLHEKILSAISAQEPENAFSEMKIHLDNAEKHNMSLFSTKP